MCQICREAPIRTDFSCESGFALAEVPGDLGRRKERRGL